MAAYKKRRRTDPTHTTHKFEAIIILDAATQKNKVKITNDRYYAYEIAKFKPGEKVTVSMTSKKPKRSEAQNRYMHLYFSLVSLSSGHTLDEIKTWAKGKFLSKGITEVFGDKVRKVNSTKDLTVSEMMEFVARVEEATGIPAPDPEPFNLAITYTEYQAMKKKQAEEYGKMEANIH